VTGNDKTGTDVAGTGSDRVQYSGKGSLWWTGA